MTETNQTPKTPISDTKKYLLLCVAAALLIGAYFIGQSIDINQTYNPDAIAKETPKEISIPKGEDISKGYDHRFDNDQVLGDKSENPRVRLIEYGSMTCPHCAHFHKNTLNMIKAQYIDSGKIQYIYRDYPLDGAALKAALLARCDLSKRSAFIDLLYGKQSSWTKGKTLKDIEKNLNVVAKMGGLSANKVSECLANKKSIKEILAVQQESSKIFDITATPTIIINNQKFTGGLEENALKAVLDQLLNTQMRSKVMDQKKLNNKIKISFYAF